MNTIVKLFVTVSLGVALVAAIAVMPRAGAQGARQSFPADREEVRDAERIRAAQNALNADSRMLVQRAGQRIIASGAATQALLDARGLSYDFDKLEWYLPDAAKPPTSVAAVASPSGT